MTKESATVQLFLQAFRSLTKSQRQKVLDGLEDLETQNPKFIASVEASRKSGRVSSKVVKRNAGLA